MTDTNTAVNEDIPEKFKHPETGALQADLLLKSYKELEKKLSQGPVSAAPAAPEDYCIECAHGLFSPDLEINRRLHAKGFSQDQAQEVYNLAAEKMVPMVSQIAHDFKAERELEKLVNHFGGAEKWQEVSRQLLAFGQKNLPDDVLDSLSSSYEGVVSLYRMMQSDEPSLKRGGEDNPSAVGETDLRAMMQNPRYWRDRDPSYISKVTEGFQKLYGKK